MIGAKITLRDVAKRAGVSLGTASNVLNSRSNVSEEARVRVLEAAAALGYRTQVRVSTPSTRMISVIGTIGKLNDGETMMVNPFYSYVLAGIERECQRHNLSLMFANIEVDKMNRPANLPPMLVDHQVDGVLIIGTFLQHTIHLIGKQFNKPVVLVDAYAPGSGFDSVVIDNINGAYSAVDFLIKKGHQHIGLIGSSATAYPSIRERRKGYLRALKHHHIPYSYIEDSPLTSDGGYTATTALLQRSPQITAIFACNDEAAFGVLQAAREMGREVPHTLSVIGFDDIDMTQQVSPALTSVHVDKLLLGTLAVRHLKDRAENPDRPALTTSVSTRIVVRNSVRSLKK